MYALFVLLGMAARWDTQHHGQTGGDSGERPVVTLMVFPEKGQREKFRPTIEAKCRRYHSMCKTRSQRISCAATHKDDSVKRFQRSLLTRGALAPYEGCT